MDKYVYLYLVSSHFNVLMLFIVSHVVHDVEVHQSFWRCINSINRVYDCLHHHTELCKLFVSLYWVFTPSRNQIYWSCWLIYWVTLQQRLRSSLSDDLLVTRSCCQTCLLLDVAPSLSLALTHAHSAPSLLAFRKRLKLHLFRLSCPGLVSQINCYSVWSLW